MINTEKNDEISHSLWADSLTAALPFVAWIVLQACAEWFTSPALAYAVRSAVCLGLAAALWQSRKDRVMLGFSASKTPFLTIINRIAIGSAIGMAVFIIWTVPENFSFYRTWLVWPPGSQSAPDTIPPYAPAVCGWDFTIIKLIGSAFIIAPIEEVFYRSFVYRWLQSRDFRSVSVTRFDLQAFALTTLLFAVEHDRWFVGAIAGVVYGAIAVRCGLGSAIVAHITTNLALGLYVIFGCHWGLW